MLKKICCWKGKKNKKKNTKRKKILQLMVKLWRNWKKMVEIVYKFNSEKPMIKLKEKMKLRDKKNTLGILKLRRN
jgi:hypothetical protein